MADDTRRPPTPAPAAAPRGPFPPGAVLGKVPKDKVTGPKLTPMEAEVLGRAGWNPGDPIPDLTGTTVGKEITAQYQQAVQAAELTSDASPLPPDTAPVQMPEPRDISELSAAHQAEVQAAIKQTNDFAAWEKQQAAQAAETESLAGIPGLAAAYTAANNPGVEIVDDISQRTGFDPAGYQPERFDPTVQPKPQAPPPPQAPAEPPPPVEDKAGGTQTQLCKRCGWNQSHDPVEPTDMDKYSFQATILGQQPRFRKDYTAYGGNITFIFRSLLPRETNLALDQCDHDQADGKVLSQMQYLRHLEDYRLAMSLESFQRGDGRVVELQPAHSLPFDQEKHHTCLPQLVEYIHNELFLTDHVRRTIGITLAKFQRLTEYMEARADDPDFWKAIVQPT